MRRTLTLIQIIPKCSDYLSPRGNSAKIIPSFSVAEMDDTDEEEARSMKKKERQEERDPPRAFFA
jgi:hypothetical protein